jgi:predicted transposase YbfD/YdcC
LAAPENCVHWVLDAAFDEDDSRVRQGNAPQNLAVARHLALNLLKLGQISNGGIKAKGKWAG